MTRTRSGCPRSYHSQCRRIRRRPDFRKIATGTGWDADTMSMQGLKSPQELERLAAIFGGVPVVGILPDSPAAREGLRYGDILLQIGDLAITDMSSFVAARKRYTEELRLRLIRDGRELELSLVL